MYVYMYVYFDNQITRWTVREIFSVGRAIRSNMNLRFVCIYLSPSIIEIVGDSGQVYLDMLEVVRRKKNTAINLWSVDKKRVAGLKYMYTLLRVLYLCMYVYLIESRSIWVLVRLEVGGSIKWLQSYNKCISG